MPPYIAEIGILVVLILAITLVHKVLIVSPLYIQSKNQVEEKDEGFANEINSLPSADDMSKQGVIDLRQERQKLVDELGRVDIASQQHPSSKTRANVRVGLERFIAEIDRALETEGRYLKISSLESIVRSAKQTLRPS
jgi:hypothetical protein